MTEPRVSICLPNLNTRPFLPEAEREAYLLGFGLIESDRFGGSLLCSFRCTSHGRLNHFGVRAACRMLLLS